MTNDSHSILNFIAWQVENRLLARKFVSLGDAYNMRAAFENDAPYAFPPARRKTTNAAATPTSTHDDEPADVNND